MVATKTMNADADPRPSLCADGDGGDGEARITKPDARALMKQLMTKDRLLVVVVGDITAEELKPKLDEMFAVAAGDVGAAGGLGCGGEGAALKARSMKQLPQPQTLVMCSGPGVPARRSGFLCGLHAELHSRRRRVLLAPDGRHPREARADLWHRHGADRAAALLAVDGLELDHERQGQSRWSTRIKENIARLGEDGPDARRSSPTPRNT